jgi:hypothetical protein
MLVTMLAGDDDKSQRLQGSPRYRFRRRSSIAGGKRAKAATKSQDRETHALPLPTTLFAQACGCRVPDAERLQLPQNTPLARPRLGERRDTQRGTGRKRLKRVHDNTPGVCCAAGSRAGGRPSHGI